MSTVDSKHRSQNQKYTQSHNHSARPSIKSSSEPRPLESSRDGIRCSRYFRWKPIVDGSLAIAMLILTAPVMGIVALLIALFDGRPIFYKQLRVGKGNRSFFIWKFRSMTRDAEYATGAVWSPPNDRRVTRLGRWLRATHLDELPQLWNVVWGDMHLIGPRPERPEFVGSLSQEIPDYHLRHAVRPGITGLAQVSQGYDANIADVHNKVALDTRYIATASPLGDLKILWLTIPYVVHEVIGYIQRQMARPSDPSRTIPDTKPVVAAELESEIQRQVAEQRALLSESIQSSSLVPPPKLLKYRLREGATNENGSESHRS